MQTKKATSQAQSTHQATPTDPMTRRTFLKAGAMGGAAMLTAPGMDTLAGMTPTASNLQSPFAQFGEEGLIELLNFFEQSLPFAGIPTFMKMPYTRDLDVVSESDLVVLGIPFDNGTLVRGGSRHGPRAMREQSLLMSSLQPIYPWQEDLTQIQKIVDFGDVITLPGSGSVDAMLEVTEMVSSSILERDARLLVLGGDHTIPYGPVRAAARKFGPLALIHLDAHQDSYSSAVFEGTVNHVTFATDLVLEGHIDLEKSSQVYIRTNYPATPNGGYNIIYADEALSMTPEEVAAQVRERIGDAPVYITLDIDALDLAYAPGTGSPVPGGPTSGDLRRFLRALDGLNVVAADVNEVNPLLDPTDATAMVASSLAIDLMYLMAHAPR